MPKPTLVRCPICGRENDFNADPLGSFCSRRCKLVDLGRWFNEDYSIPVKSGPETFLEPPEDESTDAPE